MDDLEVLRNILNRQSSLVEENKKLKEEKEEQLNASRDAVLEEENKNLVLKEEISNLNEECKSLKGQLNAKCDELKSAKDLYNEHKTEIYNHLFERVNEMKILHRDFLALKKDHEENLKKISELEAALETEKNIQAEAEESFKELQTEVACLKENLEYKKQKLLEKDKIINKHYVDLQAAEKLLNEKSITEDKMAQTEPQTADVAISTEPESITINRWCKELPEVEWVPEEGVAKLFLTFKLDGVSSIDQGSSSNIMSVKGMKRKLPLCDEPSELGDMPAKKLLKNELDSSATFCETNKFDEAQSACETKVVVNMNGSEEPVSVTRKVFLQNLQKMRDFEMETFDETKVKNQKNMLFQSMQDLTASGEEEFVVDEILNHLLTRQVDISLSGEEHSEFAVSEQLIASCLVKFISKKKSEVINTFMSKVINMISTKANQSAMGYASVCIVFSFICKKVTHIRNMRALCYEILMYCKEIAGFLIACIYHVNMEAIEFSDSRVARVWLERVIWHILSRKPSGISEEKWKETLSVHRENVQFRDMSHESPESLLQEIMSAIKKHKRASLVDLVEDFGNALKLLASYEGKEWVDAVMMKHFATYRNSIRKPEQHTNILQLLEKINCDMTLHFDKDVNKCKRETRVS